MANALFPWTNRGGRPYYPSMMTDAANGTPDRTTNAKGFDVKTPGGIVAYYADRALAAIELALTMGDDFAATLAADYATRAAHAARS